MMISAFYFLNVLKGYVCMDGFVGYIETKYKRLMVLK